MSKTTRLNWSATHRWYHRGGTRPIADRTTLQSPYVSVARRIRAFYLLGDINPLSDLSRGMALLRVGRTLRACRNNDKRLSEGPPFTPVYLLSFRLDSPAHFLNSLHRPPSPSPGRQTRFGERLTLVWYGYRTRFAYLTIADWPAHLSTCVPWALRSVKMGKLEAFDIVITNPRGVCQAGDVLRGYVIVHLLGDMDMKGKPIPSLRIHKEQFVSFRIWAFLAS